MEADRVALRIAGHRSEPSHFPADFGGAHRFSAPLLVNLFTELRGRDTSVLSRKFIEIVRPTEARRGDPMHLPK